MLLPEQQAPTRRVGSLEALRLAGASCHMLTVVLVESHRCLTHFFVRWRLGLDSLKVIQSDPECMMCYARTYVYCYDSTGRQMTQAIPVFLFRNEPYASRNPD
jgi:hypothetical protein